ncbi:MAG: hypothetical protein HY299_06935 [Verrucomicrobia bacterium]|nr:hypothetical protein [Verrucomicrobiota bacterium]
MAQFADLLALSYDANRTRHAYYRHVRLLHDHFSTDPASLSEAQLREYFLFVKLKKHWTLFSQIRARDHETLPARSGDDVGVLVKTLL